MAPPSAFANYPKPVEGPAAEYAPQPGKNPVLRGIPLLVASGIVSRSALVQRLLWNNAGFGSVKGMAVLDDVPYTFQPVVTPLGETDPMLEFGPDLVQPKYAGSKVRYYTAGDYHGMYKSGRVTPLQVAEALLPLTKPAAGAKYADA